MNILRKAYLHLKKEGFGSTLKRAIQKVVFDLRLLPVKIDEKLNHKRYIRELIEKTSGKKVFVLVPCLDWNIPVFQRPHQQAVELAKKENIHVLFLSDQYKYDTFFGIKQVNSSLDVVSNGLKEYFNEALSQASQVVLMMSWVKEAGLADSLKYDHFVYDYIDDLGLLYYCTEEMLEQQRYLMKRADVTLCTSQKLYDYALQYSRRTVLNKNAADYEFFHKNRNIPVNPLLIETEKYNCVLGYYGCLAEWFDYDLIVTTAEKRKDWCFVLIGYTFDGTVESLHNQKPENIILLPPQQYQTLPSFLAGFDIAMIPFVPGKFADTISPVKLFEYMAAGKPIVSSNMAECSQYKSVYTYGGTESFISSVEQAAKNNNVEYQALLEKEAKENTWKERIEDILRILDKHHGTK